jgi:ubiquinone/menaquinone biosynthesis C-methylase UbiE
MKRDNSMTRRFLVDAGIKPGMRVIEIGCGPGEVTELLAELVGPTGWVLAIDRDAKLLAMAQQRLREQGLHHVQWIVGDASATLVELQNFDAASFDALAGRRVLMYLPDPASTIRGLSKWLRSGALVVFEESDATLVPGRTLAMPAHDQAVDWFKQMLKAEGANTRTGFELPATFVQAGLTFERIKAEAIIQGQGTQYPLAVLLKFVAARIVDSGIATMMEIESLIAQIETESSHATSVYISDMTFCAWARKP